MRGCSGDQSGDSGDKQMAALQTNIIHLHWRCHCPVQKYHFIEGSQWILIVTRWSQDNMCWYDPKPTNKRLLQRSTSLIHRFHNWGGGCIQGKVNNSLFSLMMTCKMYLIHSFVQNYFAQILRSKILCDCQMTRLPSICEIGPNPEIIFCRRELIFTVTWSIKMLDW